MTKPIVKRLTPVIPRYTPCYHISMSQEDTLMIESENGLYVRFSDYQKLAEKLNNATRHQDASSVIEWVIPLESATQGVSND